MDIEDGTVYREDFEKRLASLKPSSQGKAEEFNVRLSCLEFGPLPQIYGH